MSLQAAVAEIFGPRLGEMLGGDPIEPELPGGGHRQNGDPMLDVIDDLHVPIRDKVSVFIEHDEFARAESEVGAMVSLMTSAAVDGLTAEFRWGEGPSMPVIMRTIIQSTDGADPTGPSTALFQLMGKERHPRLGNGVLAKLSLPSHIEPEDGPKLAKCKADDEGNGEVAKELLGLKGKLSKVVFLLDRSSSMANSGRWETAAATVTDWLKHLGMDQVAIITFGTQVEAFPDAGSFLPADDPRLVEFVQKVPVSGQTATFGALYLAFSEYADCDTFLVFTDGEPSPGYTGNTDKSAVIRLVKDQLKPSQTINVIGIGDYFSKSMRDFVKSLANHGRGAFIGR